MARLLSSPLSTEVMVEPASEVLALTSGGDLTAGIETFEAYGRCRLGWWSEAGTQGRGHDIDDGPTGPGTDDPRPACFQVTPSQSFSPSNSVNL